MTFLQLLSFPFCLSLHLCTITKRFHVHTSIHVHVIHRTQVLAIVHIYYLITPYVHTSIHVHVVHRTQVLALLSTSTTLSHLKLISLQLRSHLRACTLYISNTSTIHYPHLILKTNNCMYGVTITLIVNQLAKELHNPTRNTK